MTLRNNRFLGLVGATVIAFTPSASSASSWTVALKVGAYIASGVGLLSDTIQLSQLNNWSSIGDDHPLYSSGGTSPTLTISATETTFNLLLNQPLEIGEFEDDYPVTLSGIVKIDTLEGPADAWSYNLTFTFNKYIFDPDILDVSGELQHIRAPHPKEGEKPKAPALKVNATVAQPRSIPSPPGPITTNGPLDKQIHVKGSHYDILTENTLEATCCEPLAYNFTKWNYRLVAEHKGVPQVPEPTSTISLLALGTLGAASTLKRQLKSSKSTGKETTKVG